MQHPTCVIAATVSLALSLTLTPAAAQTLGEGGSQVQGGAGPSGSSGANVQAETCDAAKGTLAVMEPRDEYLYSLRRYNLGSPSAVLRLIIQQSRCFQIVERGQAMNTMMQERALAQSGELQQGSNIGKGQMVVADFIINPTVVFSDSNAGGVGGGILGMLGGKLGALGALAGGLKFKQAQTSILLVDARSGIQVAAAEGSAEQTDFTLGGFLGGAAMGGYSSTNEGKVIAASYLDNWNNIVRSIRNDPSLLAPTGGAAAQANAANSVRANPVTAGAVMRPKINGIKLMSGPADSTNTLGSLTKADELLLLGEEVNGYVKVTGAQGDGWVRRILLQ